jgi:hypothetical protein
MSARPRVLVLGDPRDWALLGSRFDATPSVTCPPPTRRSSCPRVVNSTRRPWAPCWPYGPGASRSSWSPAGAWDAVITHIRDPADNARLADNARSRLLYCYAIPLYRHAADAGDLHAAWVLADLLTERGDLDGAAQVLRNLAAAVDESAARRLTDLLAERGDLDGLRAQAAAGDLYAARQLADLLAERGDLDGLRARVDAGDLYAGEAARPAD